MRCARAGRAHEVRGTSVLRRPERSGDARPSCRFDGVSNLPLRVVRSLSIIFLQGGIVLDRTSIKLAVFFEEPFWVGVFERVSDGNLNRLTNRAFSGKLRTQVRNLKNFSISEAAL